MRYDRNGSKDINALGHKYNGFYTDQQAILENGDDFQLLRGGLHRMPRISTLTLRDDFQCDFDDSSHSPRAHDWYVRRSLKEFGISVHPSHCISTSFPSQIGDDYSCDLQGVAGLYKALASANVKLLNFCAGFAVAAVVPQILTIPLFPGFSLAHQLTTVEINIDSRSPVSSFAVQSQRHSPDVNLSSFPEFLHSTKLLERLGIRGESYYYSML